MSIGEKDGGPAFPVPDAFSGDIGMTVRAYAAVHIAAGLCANMHGPRDSSVAAADAVRLADRLIEELRR